MKIYDITQELFSSKVFPGDLAPSYETVASMEQGSDYNLSTLSMCAHNGTHIDAPAHFIADGKTMEELDLSKCVGEALVVTFDGDISAQEMKEVMNQGIKRVLIKGTGVITLEAAKEMNSNQIELIGVESQSVGPQGSPMEVHIELLKQEVIVLEGIVLENVPVGRYNLIAMPIKLGGLEGAPCRAILTKGSMGI